MMISQPIYTGKNKEKLELCTKGLENMRKSINSTMDEIGAYYKLGCSDNLEYTSHGIMSLLQSIDEVNQFFLAVTRDLHDRLNRDIN